MMADLDGVFMALTGTPILTKKERSSLKFGDYVDTYFYDKSIADGYTLRIKREQITTEARQAIQRDMHLKANQSVEDKEAYESADYVNALCKYIDEDFKNFRSVSHDDSVGGMIVCRSNVQARMVHQWFEAYSAIRTGLVITENNNPQQEHDNKQNGHGIGLGLWITKNSIRVLNGDLKVDSKLENGTKCTISVPLSTEKDYCEDNNYLSENQALKFIRQKNKNQTKRVLIVQNLITSKNTLRQKLICLGFDVECASTGKEALMIYREKGEGYYCAIITDAQLPEISGYELALEIRKEEKGIYLPIIALSKTHYIEDFVFSEEMGITMHISKDADISVLKAAFEKLNI